MTRKKRIFSALGFLLFTLSFLFYTGAVKKEIVQPPTIPAPDKFLYGAIHTIDDGSNNYNNYDDLGLNLWHTYVGTETGQISGKHTPVGPIYTSGWDSDDHLLSPVTDYASTLTARIDEIYSHNNSRISWQRPKIEWLVFGQSSTYEAEPISPTDDMWFYSFNNHDVGEPETDNSQWSGPVPPGVVFCSHSLHSPGFAVRRLKANTEQSHRITGSGAVNHWTGDSECDWYVKPRIRIPVSFPSSNPETPVCRVDVYNQNGYNPQDPTQNRIKSVDIKAKYFRDATFPFQYDGDYKEEFNFFGETDLIIDQDWGTEWQLCARGTCANDNGLVNKADIQVYWYDNCDMWLDYVKVENDVADKLLKGYYDDPIHPENQWIKNEVELIGKHVPPGASGPAVWKYYVELIEYNNLPCIKYINDKLRFYSDNKIDLIIDFEAAWPTLYHVPYYEVETISSPQWLYENFYKRGGFSTVFSQCYPMKSRYYDPPDPTMTFSKIPNTLPKYECSGSSPCGILALSTNAGTYDTWLQNSYDQYPFFLEDGSYPDKPSRNTGCTNFDAATLYGNMRYTLQTCSEISRIGDMPFVFMPQAHQWYTPQEINREPTNEELDLMANLAVTYGARGLMWWSYGAFDDNSDPNCPKIHRGMVNPGNILRTTNYYEQSKPKWHTFRDIGVRMDKWSPYLMSFDNTNRHSYIYRLERNDLISQTYFSDLYTFRPGNPNMNCVEDFPTGEDGPQINYKGDCKQDRYLQVATFKTGSDDPDRYFMIVNRRCSPYINDQNDDNIGGHRLIVAQFDINNSEMIQYNNWKIINVADNSTVAEFDKTQFKPVIFGWFMPGEGRLYKMVGIPRSGGTLAGDENLSGVSFTCEAPVYNNGHNITIGANTTIHFNDSSKFVMDGGVFTVGDQNTAGSQNITSDAVTGNTWKGHSFTNCEVNIYGATFTGLANDTTYALNFIDCPVVDIRGCTFNTNSSLKGGINTVCYSNPFLAINNIYIGGNTFIGSGSTIPTVNVSSYAGITTPLIIENNTFNEGNTAIFLSGVTGGAIKDNIITDNYIGINALTSSIDIAENTISSSLYESIGIFSASGSEIRLGKAGKLEIGGNNSITNTGERSNNIKVDGSYFLLADGQNIFDIASNQSANHLTGYFPYFTAVSYDEHDNCFKVDNTPVNPPVNYVTDGYQGSAITFTFTPYLTGCEVSQCEDYISINLGGGVNDTICNGLMGSGGSESGSQKRVERCEIFTTFDLHFAKEKYDSLCVLMRYHSYTQAKTKCLDLINTYPDSIQSLNAVSKLFLATVATDTSYNAANELKTYYENLILNHGSNVSLVKRVNYYILKCKVRMREYSQALEGFQQIINLNPYSYEGLIARWDYMATSLLIQGQSGGESSIKYYELGITNNTENGIDVGQRQAFDYSDIDGNGDDKNPFTKEQRKDIRKSINTAIEISKNDDETKMKTLEVKGELGDVNASRELVQLKTLKQVVKTEKPKSILEHVKIVSEDIRKVFGSNTNSKGNEPKNIPSVFRLSQNYPNPFNPTTKINYDLPRDSKVNIVIYDILGREVKRLVSNELKNAGSYIIDFNASNYASGVYFYRIEAEEPHGNKFVDSKKMVLLK